MENNQLLTEGDFNFELSDTFLTDDQIPIKKITFDWCVETPEEVILNFNKDEIIEALAEKLKQDFIKKSKQKLNNN